MNQFASWEVATKENKWQGRNITRWSSEEYDKAFEASQGELDPVKRAALVHQDERPGVQEPRRHPGRLSAARGRHLEQAQGRRSAAGTTTSGTCRTGTGRHERALGADNCWDGDAMGRYLIRRLLIAIPSLLGISIVLFTVLALAPGDPFEELATNPAVPPRCARRCAPSSASMIRWRCATCAGSSPCCRATGASRSPAASMSTR